MGGMPASRPIIPWISRRSITPTRINRWSNKNRRPNFGWKDDRRGNHSTTRKSLIRMTGRRQPLVRTTGRRQPLIRMTRTRQGVVRMTGTAGDSWSTGLAAVIPDFYMN